MNWFYKFFDLLKFCWENKTTHIMHLQMVVRLVLRRVQGQRKYKKFLKNMNLPSHWKDQQKMPPLKQTVFELVCI